MFGNLGDTFNTALAIVSIATLTGLGLMRGTITNLRENLRDARDEIADKDRRLTETEGDLVRLRAQVKSQGHDLEAVGRLIRGESYWTELGEKLDAHHSEAKKHWLADELKLDAINGGLAGLRADLGKRRETP
jgi:chromosome segregation ATPase